MTDGKFADEQLFPDVDKNGAAQLHGEANLGFHQQSVHQQGKTARAGSFEIPRVITSQHDINRQRRASSSYLFNRGDSVARFGNVKFGAKSFTAFKSKDCVPRENRVYANSPVVVKRHAPVISASYSSGLNSQNMIAMSASDQQNRSSTPPKPAYTMTDAIVRSGDCESDGSGLAEQNSDVQKNAGFKKEHNTSRRRSSLQYTSSGMLVDSSNHGLSQKADGDVVRTDDEAFAPVNLIQSKSAHDRTPISATSPVRVPGIKQQDGRRTFSHRYNESNASSAMSDITQYTSAVELRADARLLSSSTAAVASGEGQMPWEIPTTTTPTHAVKVYRTASHSQIGTKSRSNDVSLPQHIIDKPGGGNEPSASGSQAGSHVGKKKRGSTWLQALNPNYKYRAEEFKRYFVTPSSQQQYAEERLVIDYSCALHREILCQGRMYCSQYRLCFRFNIFGVERSYAWPWTHIASIYKDKTALIIPNAISVRLAGKDGEHLFFTTFNARDKAFAMLLRLWQSANSTASKSQSVLSVSGAPSIDSRQQAVMLHAASSDVAPLTADEIWGLVHFSYGDDLGLTTDDEDDYIPPAYLKYSYDEIHDNAAMLASGSSGGSGSSKTKAAFLDSSRQKFASGNSSKNFTTKSTAHATTSKSRPFATNRNQNTIRTVKDSDAAVTSIKPLSAATNSNSFMEMDAGRNASKREEDGNGLSRKQHESGDDHYAVHEDKQKNYAEANDKARRTYAIEDNSPALTSDVESDGDEIDLSTIIPENLPEPAGLVVLDEHFDLSVDQVFVMLFSDSKFSRDFYARRNFSDCQPNAWGDVSPEAAEFAGTNHADSTATTAAVHERSITYKVKIMPGQYSTSIERQRLLPESINGYLYLVETEVRNSGLMYCDSFAIHCHYALTRTGDNSCRLRVHGEPVFLKRVLLAKSMIESRVSSTFQEHFGTLRLALQEAARDEIPKLMANFEHLKSSAAGNESEDLGGDLKQKMPELHKLADPPSSRRTSMAPSAASKQRRHDVDFSLSSNSSFASITRSRKHNQSNSNQAKKQDVVDDDLSDTSDGDNDEKRSTLRAHVAPPTASTSQKSDSIGNVPRHRKTSSKLRQQNQSPAANSLAARERGNETLATARKPSTAAGSTSTVISSSTSYRCSACGHSDAVLAAQPGWGSPWMRDFASTHSLAVTVLLCTLISVHLLLLWRLGANQQHFAPINRPLSDDAVGEQLSASLAGLNATMDAVQKQLGVLLAKLAVGDGTLR